MASGKATSTDGPILALLNRRIRNLKKKLKRIAPLEDGSVIIKNKDQEKLLKSKPTIIAAVDELEKIRQPLSVAVDEEITLALQRHTHNDNDEDRCNKPEKALDTVSPVDDLLSLIYLGNMFDVKSKRDFHFTRMRSKHERTLCLIYDSNNFLTDMDLDMMTLMASLLTSSRGSSSLLSHQNALQRCIQHANLWLSKSQQQIVPNSHITYAGLREKLTTIMGLDYSINPLSADDVAAAVARKSRIKQQKEVDMADHQSSETSEDQSSVSELLKLEEWFYNHDEGEQEPWRPFQCPRGILYGGRNSALCSLMLGRGGSYKIWQPEFLMAQIDMAGYDSE